MWQTLSAQWQALTSRPDFYGFVSIPFVAAVVTWAHVWVAMKMVFYPVRFVGIAPPWLGWQGIVPRKAGKMAGIVVDNTLSKVASLREVFHELEPKVIAEHISRELSDRVEEFIDEIIREHKKEVLWENLPSAIKRPIYERVRRQIPEIMDRIVADMDANVEELVDLRDMIVRRIEADRALMVRIFYEVGDREIHFIVNASFWIGMFFGCIQMMGWYFVPWDWGLPAYGAALGYLTNWVALNMVFRPLEPTRVLFWKVQGVFLRRQKEVSEKFAVLSTQEMVTVKHLMTEILVGRRADRTRAIIKRHLAPVLEGGLVGTAIQLTFGPAGYAELKRAVVEKAARKSLEPLEDPGFNRARASVLARIFAARMKAMTPAQFQALLRPAFQEDEWILIALGAIMGFAAGWVQLVVGFR